MKRVVSIRIEPSVLAGIYDFLEHVCSYDTSHLPVSTATQIAMEAIVEWFKRKGELPSYATDEDALARIGDNGRYVPGACLPDATERITPVPRNRTVGRTRPLALHRTVPYIACLPESEQVIEQNLIDNSMGISQLPHVPRQAVDPNVLKSKQEHMISLIDQFMAKEEDAELTNMIAVVKETNIYKEEL